MQQLFPPISFRRQLIVLCCLLFSFNSWSQIYEAWASRYNDPGTLMDFGQAIATDAAGNVYVTGRSEFAWSTTLMSADITTIKYDSRGNQVWLRKYNSPFDRWDDAVDIAVDASGNIIITGSSRSANYDDIITIKYNANGDKLWEARYDGPQHGSDWGSALALDAAGNIYVT